MEGIFRFRLVKNGMKILMRILMAMRTLMRTLMRVLMRILMRILTGLSLLVSQEWLAVY